MSEDRLNQTCHIMMLLWFAWWYKFYYIIITYVAVSGKDYKAQFIKGKVFKCTLKSIIAFSYGKEVIMNSILNEYLTRGGWYANVGQLYAFYCYFSSASTYCSTFSYKLQPHTHPLYNLDF